MSPSEHVETILQTHKITLHNGDTHRPIVLRPLRDEHLPLLYRWNADPEVLYWSEGDDVQSYDEESVRGIYGKTSQTAFCFLIEAAGVAVGEMWLQRMNLPAVLARYSGLDVRRIDTTIGEKEYWGRGIGTEAIGMLVKFAFEVEGVDVLHSVVSDYNMRSRKSLMNNGYRLAYTEDLPEGAKAKQDYHYALTRRQYEMRRG